MSAPTAQSRTTEVGMPASINDLIIAPLENHKINMENNIKLDFLENEETLRMNKK